MSQENDLLEDDVKPSFSVSMAPKSDKETPKKTPVKKGFVAPVKSAKKSTETSSPKPQANKKQAASEGKAKRVRKPPAKKRRAKEESDDEDDEEETESKEECEEDENDAEEDDDEEEEEEEDPEDEDVAGKGYSTVVVFTSVPNNGRKELVDAVRKHGAHMTRDVGLATHAVCAQPQRTIKLMCAILRGLWIVTPEWVKKSQGKETMPPEESFELSTFPGIRKSRLMHSDSGFKVCTLSFLFVCALFFTHHPFLLLCSLSLMDRSLLLDTLSTPTPPRTRSQGW